MLDRLMNGLDIRTMWRSHPMESSPGSPPTRSPEIPMAEALHFIHDHIQSQPE